MSQKKIKIPTKEVTVTPNGKKLVQARLPFKTLASAPKVGTDPLVTGENRKRKLSTTEDDNRSIKLSKTTGGAKENIEKTNEVTVLEMVDLVENDIVMTDNDISPTDESTKPTKKSTKDVEVKDTPLRRSNRKIDSDVPAKVVIKIPSAKKKKSNERQSKAPVVSKIIEIDDDDDDDDAIPIDSEDNSLNSVDGKEKEVNSEADNSIVLIEDLDEVKDSKVVDSTSEEVKPVPSIIEAADSSDNLLDKDQNIQSIVKDNDALTHTEKSSDSDGILMATESESVPTVETETNQLDATIADEEIVSSSSDKTDSESGSEESNVKEEKSSPRAEKTSTSDSVADSKVEDKIDSDFDQNTVSTPSSSTVERRTRKSVDNSVTTTPKTPALKTSDKTALTPKQLQKKLELEQKRLAKEKAKEERERKIQEAKEERERKLQEAKEERERKIQEAKEERERKLQEEKELRQKERDEKERQRKKERDDKEEQKRKEREDKEEQKRKEKEEREKKKQAEIDAKNEEKRQKEEEKVAREEAELKKKRKEVEAFTKFFAKKSNKSTESDKMDVDDVEVQLNFMPFRVKHDMRLAPTVRRQLSPTTKSKFDDQVLNSTHNCPSTDLYIHSLRNGVHVSEKQGKTWRNEETNDDDDLMIVDDLEGATAIEETSAIQKYRAKFFKFEENRRPPYYGTWQKKSSVIKPRRPFVTDQKYFDYEVDSDDEWEDEEPGESLHGSDDEKDKESDDDYDIDNEFFVPHGHLSDEELDNNDEIDDDNSPDTQKAKLKIMQKVFSDEMKKKTEKIKPRLVGLIWQNKDGSQPVTCPNVIWEMLQMRSMIFNGPSIVMPIIQIDDKNDACDENGESKKGSAMKKRVKLTEEVVADLLRLVHGNTNGCEFLSREFRAFTAQKNIGNDKFQEFSLTSIRMKIKELAEWKQCPDEGPMMNKNCWYVSNEQRKHYNMEDLSVINEWNYTLTPKTKTKPESKKMKETDKGKSPPDANDDVPASSKTPKSKLGNIAKFTKILSDDEKKKNFSIPVHDPSLETLSSKPKPDAEPSPKPVKKRVNLLMSVPRGQEIPVQTKNSLISQYLSNAKSNKKATDDAPANSNKTFPDEPICID